jgi:hypothetical protein
VLVSNVSDSDGGRLLPGDVANMTLLVSPDLINWTPATNALILTNGAVLFQAAATTNSPQGFYEVIESQ